MKLKKILKYLITWLLPDKFVKHYIWPLFIRKRKKYNATHFFNQMYSSAENNEFSDGVTINPIYNPLYSKFHYNNTENSIIKTLIDLKIDINSNFKLLDIGSGAGHWIEFYKNLLRPKSITSIDLSDVVVKNLKEKYLDNSSIEIIKKDISDKDFNIHNKFNLINAVGVIFHIVDDDAWIQAIRNLSYHLDSNGIIIIGGSFGNITQDVQFHHKDEFLKNKNKKEDNTIYVNKRIRSLRYWKKCAHLAGLEVINLQKTLKVKNIRTPENNILCLRKK